jgi:hypothetical protein
MGMCTDETYAKKLGPYMVYYKNILELLSNPCQLKIQPYWKVFGLRTIGDLIMCEVPSLPLLMLILKTHLLFHIVVLKTWDHHWK